MPSSVCSRPQCPDGTIPASFPRPHFHSQKQSWFKDKLDIPYINKTNTHSSRNQKYFLNVYKSIINAYNINHKFLAHIKILKGQILKQLVYACVYMYPIYSKYNTFNILSILLINIFIQLSIFNHKYIIYHEYRYKTSFL